MKKVRITAIRKASYPDLMAKYENPISHACDVEEGQVWIANGWEKPAGFCDSAWDSISAFVMTPGPRGRKYLRRLDEESKVRHDLLQRWIPSRQLLYRSTG